MTRFERVDGYNAIKDNNNQVYTLAEYEPKQYNVGEFDIEDMLNLLNGMNNEIISLRNQIARMQSKLEEDE